MSQEPHWTPSQPFVTIAGMKSHRTFAIAIPKVVVVRDDTFAVWSPNDELLFSVPLRELGVRTKNLQVEVQHGAQRRWLNTMPSGATIRPKLGAAFARHAGPGVAYRPLTDPVYGGFVSAMSGGGFALSKEIARGNRALVAILIALGARDVST